MLKEEKIKRRYLIMSVGMLLFMLLSISITACAPPEEPSSANAPAALDNLNVIASPIANQIATLSIPWDLLHYRVIRVPPGWFALGADPEKDSLSRGDEIPQTNTHEPGFWMSESEVTNREYALCLEAGVCSSPSLRETGPTNHFGNPAYDDHPVVGVNWFQAEGYCEWTRARLPTEAEWEKAARGTISYTYPWGNDAPTCDRANAQIPGCESEGDTKPTGSYPLGVSRYGFFDMAGNVKEWMLDWYAPDAYLTTAAYMPVGPAEGDKKAVRGGGFNDFKENLRTTARWGYAPGQDFDDVGFRCVPVTPSYASFCKLSYTQLCYDPDMPRKDEPCVPGQNVPGEEGVTLLGFGCPMNKIVCFQLSTNDGGSTGYTAMVDEDGFTCKQLDERPDILECCGPEQPMGRNVEITICSPGGSPEGAPVSTTAMNISSGITLASFGTSGVVSLIRTTAPNCPDGYIYDSETRECLLDQTGTPCPENWTYDRKSAECIPDNPEEDCPPTTAFSATLVGCQPEDEECPKGYYLTEKQLCEPDQNRGNECLPGYYFNTEINCCEPIMADNFGCQDRYYWNGKYEKCVPIDDYNCAFNMTYNGYGACNQDPGTPGPDDPKEGGSALGFGMEEGDLRDLFKGHQIPDNVNPLPDTELRMGDQIGLNKLVTPELGPAQPDCSEGYYYHEKYERCIERDPDGCALGYFLDRETQHCLPTNGPGSPCPLGFAYNSKTECCVPEPGWDSTRCSQDVEYIPETSFQEMPIDPYDSNQEMPIDPYGTTDFDPVSGRCEDGDRIRKSGKPENCPPGLLATNVNTCDQYPSDGVGVLPDPCKDLKDPKLCQAACPEEYWSQEANTCDYPGPECGVNEYFDRRLGYCIPLQNDCCEIGQDYSAFYKECMDVVTKPRDGECPNGFELIDELCRLIGRTEGQGGMCWTITRNTPQCVGPCEVGLLYNEATGRCDKPPEPEQPADPCANVNCSSYTASNCPSNCCKQAAASNACVPK